jgi:predicted NAD-dependent protein-ADP-ribosyltransferase YbiA (DUF1768 family)
MYNLDDQIRNALTAKEAKTIANQIKVNETWKELRPVIMAEILKIKYTQCADFRGKLTNSKGYLDQNVKCSFWGTGPDGKGQNVFGLLLAALRIWCAVIVKLFLCYTVILFYDFLLCIK